MTRVVQIALDDIPGFTQSKKGTMYREVCSADITLVELTNITPSQASSGTQYLRNSRIECSLSFALANPQSNICQAEIRNPKPEIQRRYSPHLRTDFR